MAFGAGEVLQALQKRGVAVGAHFGVAEFALVPAFHLAAQLLGHGLHAVANAQHGHAQREHRLRRAVGAVFIGAGVAAGEDDALELPVSRVLAHPFVADVAGVDFAIHVRLAHAAGNELGDLGAEIEDEDFVMGHFLRKRGAPQRAARKKAGANGTAGAYGWGGARLPRVRR